MSGRFGLSWRGAIIIVVGSRVGRLITWFVVGSLAG